MYPYDVDGAPRCTTWCTYTTMLLSTTTDNMIGVGVGPHDVPDDVGSDTDHGVGSDRDLGNCIISLHSVHPYSVVLSV